MPALYRRLRIWLIALLTVPFVVAGLLAWFVLTQEDRIISLVVGRINTRLATPVRIDKITLALWDDFPRVAVRMDSVIIQESCLGHTRRLAALRQVRLAFSLSDIWNGVYIVERLTVSSGYVRMRHLPDGTPNYDIIKPNTTPKNPGAKPLAFELRAIVLDSIAYSFAKEAPASALLVAAGTKHIEATLKVEGNQTDVLMDGQVRLAQLKTGGQRLATDLPVILRANRLRIHTGDKMDVLPGGLMVGRAAFDLAGTISLAKPGTYAITLATPGASLQTLAVLLPERARATLAPYKTSGHVYFSGSISKRDTGTAVPTVALKFGCSRAAFIHPGGKLHFEATSFAGALALQEGRSAEGFTLSLKNVQGTLEGRPFSAALALRGLARPVASGQVQATLPLAFFAEPLAAAGVKNPQGLLALDVHFTDAGLGQAATKGGKMQADGQVTLSEVSCVAGPRALLFADWAGVLRLKAGSLSADGLGGRIGRSDLALDGHFENLLGYLAGERPALGMDVSLASNYLDLDELLAAQPKAAPAAGATHGEDERYRFSIAPQLRVHAQCRVGRMRFRRFTPRLIAGQLHVGGQRARLEGVQFYEAGGHFNVGAEIDAATPGLVKVQSDFALDGVRMDSLFYLMEDFNQKTLRHDQIKGKLRAGGKLAMDMDPTLDVRPGSILADVDIVLTEGSLLHFEPAQALGRFIDKEELKYLQFDELTNHLTIRNQVLTIPEMDIRSNVIRVYVQGSHTFSQQMDYHLRIPMAYIGETRSSLGESAPTAGGNLMLAMRGTPDKVKISYDAAAVKNKIIIDLKEEKQSVLNLFKRKKKEADAPEPGQQPAQTPDKTDKKEDEYFNFD